MRTVLVSMPFMSPDLPSIQLGLLKAIGEQQGFEVRTLHANLDFAARIGAGYYRALADSRGPLIGDWLFSVAAFGTEAPDPDGGLLDAGAVELSHLAEHGAEPGHESGIRDRLRRIRDHEVPALLDALADGYPWHEVRGTSSRLHLYVPANRGLGRARPQAEAALSAAGDGLRRGQLRR
jgi:hypothetical protein